MPLREGNAPAVVSQNISEFHKGPTFAHTAEKFGKKQADKQAVAVALSEARRTGKGQSMPAKPSTGRGHSGSHTSVGCGHASCGVGKGCSVGKGQKADFLKRSASADRPVGRGQAKRTGSDDERAEKKDEKAEVQHERQEMKLVKKLEKMHPPSMLTGKGQRGRKADKTEAKFPDTKFPPKLRVGTGQAAPAVGTGAGHHVRGQGRKASSPRIGIPERPMLPPTPRPPTPPRAGGPWGDPPRTNVPAGRPSIQPMPPTPAPSGGGGSVFGGGAGGSFAAPDVGALPPKPAPMGGGGVAPPSGGLKPNMPPSGPSPAGLGVKPEPGTGQARRRVGTGQSPVIPGIQQMHGSQPPVDFGLGAVPPYVQGAPRSTRMGAFNPQGQGPPQQKGKRSPGRPKQQGATVHPSKGRMKMTP